MRKLSDFVGSIIGLSVGTLIWLRLIGDFQESVEAQVLEHLKQIPSFGTLFALSAVALILGSSFLISYLARLIYDVRTTHKAA